MIKQIGIGLVLFTHLLSVMSNGNYMQHYAILATIKSVEKTKNKLQTNNFIEMHVLTERAVGNDYTHYNNTIYFMICLFICQEQLSGIKIFIK